ncbi:MAG: PD-(D/E)XK nuclease family protein [Proteobacteria bacterium]|nr:PD-(D/E)XK nuclease family protein [Pseudomonadota bacterium]
MAPRIALHLYPHADAAWTEVIRPWLQAGAGQLQRSHVIVPTRGQAQAWKQRCLRENVALLGVEFLTPGLARQKWLGLTGESRPAMGRELLLLGLRTLIARRLAALAPEDPAWGFWQSLQSDPERALDDFDELLKAGFTPADFPLTPLRGIFGELTAWIEASGYALAAQVAERAGLAPLAAAAPRIGGRVLVAGLGPELWGEFFNVAAFVRRCAEVTAVLPEPVFDGGTGSDEKWIALWSALLGVEPQPIEAADAAPGGQAVAQLWGRAEGSAGRARVLVGRTRGDEMRLVAGEIAARLAAGAENIGVVFPQADPAHLELARLLAERDIGFVDLLETAGPPPVDVQAQRALLAFYARGARIEELLALWPLLRATGAVTLALADARRAVEGSFDLRQTHAVAAHQADWAAKAPELARVAAVLLPAWPAELALGEALRRFRAVVNALELEEPVGWGALDALAVRRPEPLPVAVILAALGSFLPAQHPVKNAPGRGGFARVTLGTRRRMEGVAWSHLVLVESNAGSWPARREPSCWLTDEQRAALNERGRFSLGLLTSDERAALDRAGYQALMRDTRDEVIFTAALFAEQEPEIKLAPNAWVERVLWAQGRVTAETGLEAAFDGLARELVPRLADSAAVSAWRATWAGRHEETRPFDEYFFAGDPAKITPEKLSAKQIERAVQDPAELWFEAVLRAKRVPWEPLARARRKALGQQAHALLAAALQPTEVAQGFGEMPPAAEAGARLQRLLAAGRAQWPADFYWDSFHAELAHFCAVLLENVYALDAGRYVATELWLPAHATLALGTRSMPVVGRMDLVRLDRPQWRGAQVDIVDFKTGGDQALTAERMARSGAGLQLGVYLAAARSLGAAAGRVWMLRPEPGAVTMIGFEALEAGLKKLDWLGEALDRGVYGALTKDRSDYAPPGYVWPLACTPVRHAVLKAKFARTFGATEAAEVADE